MKERGAAMKILQTVVLVGFGLLAFFVDCPLNAQQAIELSLRAKQATVRAGSEVRVEATLRNISNHEIGVLRSSPNSDYFIDVQDAHGRSVALTELGRKLRAPDAVRVTPSNVLYPVAPRATLVDEIIISQLFDLSHPGGYTIEAKRKIPDELGAGIVTSNKVTVVVTK
jgi:uncharacterized protein (DUF58 family)